jgi:hypothetical protein
MRTMKLTHVIFSLATALSIAGLFPRVADASEAALKPGEAKAKMEAARLDIATLRTNIVLTLVELDQVRRAENRQTQLQRFGLQLTNMVGQVQLIATRARAMQQRGDAYFADWEARTGEIQDPEKRASAESRYAARKRSYDRITANLQEARANFEPLLSDLSQIQKLLEDRPDMAKVAAAKNVFMHANWRCIDVQRSLMEVEAEFTFLAADFAQNEQ